MHMRVGALSAVAIGIRDTCLLHIKGNCIRVKEERPHEARSHGRARR
jgi:hypothetical protein